jgi:nitroimidazol reductase NimA-like FMN-containing flavoprotein (pyridoxamine 5'-phosphate oxidase superfamily)
VSDTRIEELAEAECRSLLAGRHLGRLALVDDRGPVILPVNYVVDRDAPVFRTDPGTKLDAVAEGAAVAFEVDATDEATRTGWSVVVRGALGEVTDPEDLERLRALPLYPWSRGDEARYLRVAPASLTGRRIRIPDELPFTWWG